MMATIFFDELSIDAMVPTTCKTTVPPLLATSEADKASWLVRRAFSAFCLSVDNREPAASLVLFVYRHPGLLLEDSAVQERIASVQGIGLARFFCGLRGVACGGETACMALRKKNGSELVALTR